MKSRANRKCGWRLMSHGTRPRRSLTPASQYDGRSLIQMAVNAWKSPGRETPPALFLCPIISSTELLDAPPLRICNRSCIPRMRASTYGPAHGVPPVLRCFHPPHVPVGTPVTLRVDASLVGDVPIQTRRAHRSELHFSQAAAGASKAGSPPPTQASPRLASHTRQVILSETATGLSTSTSPPRSAPLC